MLDIHGRDLNSLKWDSYITDMVIDLRIEHMIYKLEPQKREVVYNMGSLFYPRLRKGRSHPIKYNRFADIFAMDFLFLAINPDGKTHWSLLVVVRPLLFLIEHYLNDGQICNEYFKDKGRNIGCLLHMDSSKFHNSSTIFTAVKLFLSERWKQKHSSGGVPKATSTLTEYAIRNGVPIDSTAVIEDLINCKLYEQTSLFEGIPELICQVPIQTNSYDCGFYVIRNVQFVIDTMLSTKPDDVEQNLISILNDSIYSVLSFEETRSFTKDLILELFEEYIHWQKSQPAVTMSTTGNDSDLEAIFDEELQRPTDDSTSQEVVYYIIYVLSNWIPVYADIRE